MGSSLSVACDKISGHLPSAQTKRRVGAGPRKVRGPRARGKDKVISGGILRFRRPQDHEGAARVVALADGTGGLAIAGAAAGIAGMNDRTIQPLVAP